MAGTTGAMSGHTTQLDAALVDDVERRYIEGWNALDGDALAALCTEDVVWDEAILPRNLVGREEVRAYIEACREAMPDFHAVALGEPCIAATEPKALVPLRITATVRGTWSWTGLRATGGRMDIPIIDEWTFRGELLSHYRTYYDTLDFCRQIGVMPPVGWFENGERHGSAADRLLTRIVNLRTRLSSAAGSNSMGEHPKGYRLRR